MTDDIIADIDQVLDDSWADAARWTPDAGWSEPEPEPADDDPDGWYMDYDEDYPPPDMVLLPTGQWTGVYRV